MPTPAVLLGDEARARLREGLDLLAHLISLTLGPRAGTIASSRIAKDPELLTSSAVVARRIVEISGRAANAGAMLLRHAVWQVHQQLGDGGATTAALAHALLGQGQRYLAAGANPMRLRHGLNQALPLAVAALQRQSRPLDPQRHIQPLAAAATADPDLARAFGAIYGRLGPEVALIVEEYAATYLAHQILEGTRWEGAFVSPAFVADQARQQTLLHDAAVLVTDQTIAEPSQIVPLLDQVARAGVGPLLILAEDVTGPARALLLANRERGVLDTVAATLTMQGSHRRYCYEDLAILTGASFVSRDRGDRLEQLQATDLGFARQAQVGTQALMIVGGAGNPALLAERRQVLRAHIQRAVDEEARQKLIERLGKLAGAMALLKIGAPTPSERAVRVDLAHRFIRFVPAALEEGVLPGGGAAFLACQPALDDLALGYDEDALGAAMLRQALEAPMAWLVRNAGRDPAPVLAEARRLGPPWGFDVLREEYADMWEATIVDSAKVARVALETAVSLAGATLTTEGLVLSRKPQVVLDP